MNEKPKNPSKMEGAIVVGEIVLAGVTLVLRVAGLWNNRSTV